MCHLVMDSSQNVQQMAYHILREAAVRHTESVVIEAAVDTEAEIKPELPPELIEILQRTIELAEGEDNVNGNQARMPHLVQIDSLTNIISGIFRKSAHLDVDFRSVYQRRTCRFVCSCEPMLTFGIVSESQIQLYRASPTSQLDF